MGAAPGCREAVKAQRGHVAGHCLQLGSGLLLTEGELENQVLPFR